MGARAPRARAADDVVLAAVQQHGYSFVFASPKVQADRDVIFAATNYGIFKAFNNDKEMVLIALEKDGDLLADASEALQGNKEVVLAAVKQDGEALRDASVELRMNVEIVFAALMQNTDAWRFAEKHGFLEEDDLVRAARHRRVGASRLDVVKEVFDEIASRCFRTDAERDAADETVALVSRVYAADEKVQEMAQSASAAIHNPLADPDVARERRRQELESIGF
jgi:NhaP-type Na+/H+ and K+/H+ antiporter